MASKKTWIWIIVTVVGLGLSCLFIVAGGMLVGCVGGLVAALSRP